MAKGGGHTEGHTDVQMSGNSSLCPTGHRPFGAAAQKGGVAGMSNQILEPSSVMAMVIFLPRGRQDIDLTII